MSFNLDLRRLRYFRAIVEQGSLTAAARALNVAQPALSHHISELEASLGVPLLSRTHKGAELTEAGRVLLGHAETILENVAVAEAELVSLAGRSAWPPVINFAMTPSLAVIAPPLIEVTQRTFSGTQLHIAEVRSEPCRNLIAKGQLDFAITYADDAANGLPLASTALLYVTCDADEEDTEDAISFAELAQRPLVLPSPEVGLRRLIEGVAAERGVKLNVAVEIDGLVFRKEAVFAGLGDTILAWHNIVNEVTTGRVHIRPVVEPQITRQLVLDHRDGLAPQLVRKFHALLGPLLAGRWTTLAKWPAAPA